MVRWTISSEERRELGRAALHEAERHPRELYPGISSEAFRRATFSIRKIPPLAAKPLEGEGVATRYRQSRFELRRMGEIKKTEINPKWD